MSTRNLPILKTPRLVLRPFRLSESKAVAQLANDKDIATNTENLPYPYEEYMAVDWITAHQRLFEEDKLLTLAIALHRPGPGAAIHAPATGGALGAREDPGTDLDREIEIIAAAVADRGTIDRDELARLVGARYWGPGRFRGALRETVEEGRIRRDGARSFAPAGDDR